MLRAESTYFLTLCRHFFGSGKYGNTSDAWAQNGGGRVVAVLYSHLCKPLLGRAWVETYVNTDDAWAPKRKTEAGRVVDVSQNDTHRAYFV